MNVDSIRKTIEWKSSRSWVPLISSWLRPLINKKGMCHLISMGRQEIFCDDIEWMSIIQSVLKVDLDWAVEKFADRLARVNARVYHGCRTKDAGFYLRQGIIRNNPNRLVGEVREILRENSRVSGIEEKIDEILRGFREINRDEGCLYLVIDDRNLIKYGGHYLIYGSEWIQCLFRAEDRSFLRERGFPKIIVVDLPLAIISASDRRALAEKFIATWAWRKVNKERWLPEIDFTLCLRENVPSSFVVGHYHPKSIPDPYFGRLERERDETKCPSCPEELSPRKGLS